MTICIAAINDNEDIVAIADNKFTVQLPVVSGYEINENKKIVEVGKQTIALFAGHIVNANGILDEAKKHITPESSVAEIASRIKEAYQAFLNRAINDEVLSKYGLTLTTFNQQQQTLEATFVKSVFEIINQANLGVEIIVAGKDENGPQIYKILNPGAMSNETAIGYSTVGSGSHHANLSLIESKQHQACKFETTLYSVVNAKKHAELDPNVGDMSTLVLVNSGIDWVDKQKLDKIIKEYASSVKSIADITKKSSTIMKGILNGT